MADSGVSNGSRADTKAEGSPPRLTEIRLVRRKKFDIFVEGGLTSMKHKIRISISIISSQLGGRAETRVSFLSKPSSIGATPPSAPS